MPLREDLAHIVGSEYTTDDPDVLDNTLARRQSRSTSAARAALSIPRTRIKWLAWSDMRTNIMSR